MKKYIWFDLCLGCLVISNKKDWSAPIIIEWPDGNVIPETIKIHEFMYIGEL